MITGADGWVEATGQGGWLFRFEHKRNTEPVRVIAIDYKCAEENDDALICAMSYASADHFSFLIIIVEHYFSAFIVLN